MQQMTLSPQQRRYIRRDNPPAFRITPRVLAILDALRRFGLLTSTQIARIDAGSHQKVLRRLQVLFDHGIVDRPGSAQLTPLTSFFDARPATYALSRKGARVLAEAGVDIDVKLDRSSRNKRALLIEHAINVAEVMLAFQAACCAQGGVRLVDQHDLFMTMPTTTRSRRKPLCVYTPVRASDHPNLRRLLKEPVEIGTEPDRLFSLILPDNTGWSFALELDRATERVLPKHLKGTSILRKQLGYFAAWRAGRFLEHWGPAVRALRVLTVTPSERRIQSMLESQTLVTGGSAAGLFLYSTPARLAQHGPLGPAWISGKHDGITLLDP